MGAGVEWKTSEVAYLLDNAGRIPRREICKSLRRSTESVRYMAKRLRKDGIDISLRCYTPRVEICPACGCSRSTLERSGVCEPCERREQLATVHGRIAELMPLLAPEDAAVYVDTEAETESRIDPKPMPPEIPPDASYYRRMKAEEQHDMAVEAWAVRNIKREIKAAQKRKERIEKKVSSYQVGREYEMQESEHR